MTTNQMKLSDYVAAFLARCGMRHAFIITGGASLHILQSLEDQPGIEPICPHHEQAAAMAADAYARVTGNIGCAVGTSGPGATNLITGIAGAWFDSVPTLFITGQVATYRMKGMTPIRQMGFQETDILPMVRPITKHAIQITDPSQIAYELERAIDIARSGRPGPVVLDLPDDLQRAFIVPDDLRHYTPHDQGAVDTVDQADVNRVHAALASAKRPVLILGWGVYLASAAERARKLAEILQIPVLTSWGAKDMFPDSHPLLVGTFGTHGIRPGNFAVQNADLVLAIGARLSTHETGTPLTDWARAAKIIVIDIDQGELDKFPAFGKPLEQGICADAGVFIDAMLTRNTSYHRAAWFQYIKDWKHRYPAGPTGPLTDHGVEPYTFVSSLGVALPANEQVFIDTGCAIAWMMQAFPVRGTQRLFHDFNNTAMGWALPAAIGGCFALDKSTVTCVVGDGSLMMNVHELATVRRHALPIRIFILNNDGYSMVKQTQDQWMKGSYAGTSIEGGLGFPDYEKLAASFNLPYVRIDRNEDVADSLQKVMSLTGPVIINVCIPSTARVMPQSKFGFPIEDAEPLLARNEFAANMIVAPLPRSLMDVQ